MTEVHIENVADRAEDRYHVGCQGGCSPGLEAAEPLWITVTYAVIGLTNFGERPVPSARLAEVLGRPVSEAEALARQWGWPGTRVENGLITVDPERARSATRRHVQVGDRRFGVTGCACDIFYYAPLARPSLQLEDTCPATGIPIRLVFTPSGVEHVEPAGAVVATMEPQECTTAIEDAASEGDIEDVDGDVCVRSSLLFASAEAAQGWLGANPGGSVLPIRDMWDLTTMRDWREQMSALLDPDPDHEPADVDAGPADFLAGSCPEVPTTVTLAVIGLTNFGERPVPSARLAEVVGRPVGEAEALARQWGWSGTRVEDGLITVDPERAKSASRRQLQVGDRRFGMTGCAPDIFLYAPLARPSLQVEETCPATGTRIRLVFTPSRVEQVEPAGAVVAVLDPHEATHVLEEAARDGDIEDVDAAVCGQMPLFASAEAAHGWLADHPGGRVLPIREAWDLSTFRDWRDKMSGLLNLGQ